MNKQIVKIKDLLGTDIRTRSMIEVFSQSLQKESHYLFDMEGVETISRSAADELYNLIEDSHHILLVNMSDFVQKMFDIVAVGRFSPRQLKNNEVNVTYCPDMESLSKCLNTI